MILFFPALCSSPMNLTNGYWVIHISNEKYMGKNMFLENTTATYSCHNGYTQFGDLSSVCQRNGTWIPAPPICLGKNKYKYDF